MTDDTDHPCLRPRPPGASAWVSRRPGRDPPQRRRARAHGPGRRRDGGRQGRRLRPRPGAQSRGRRSSGGATWLGVAQLAEAMELRHAASPRRCSPGCFVPGADFARRHRRRHRCHRRRGGPWTRSSPPRTSAGATARIHLKVDTGLGRDGVLDRLARDGRSGSPRLRGRGRRRGHRRVVALRLGRRAAAPDGALPAGAVRRGVRELERAGVRPRAAAPRQLRRHADQPRARTSTWSGRAWPSTACRRCPTSATRRLRPARGDARHGAPVVVKRARAGQGVSYGHEYVTDRDTVLGLVPMGYADGIPRSARATSGRCSVGGGRHTVAGRVCMDQFVVDLGAGVLPGAPVTRSSSSGAAPTGSRRRRTGRRRRGRSTTRSSPASGTRCPGSCSEAQRLMAPRAGVGWRAGPPPWASGRCCAPAPATARCDAPDGWAHTPPRSSSSSLRTACPARRDRRA